MRQAENFSIVAGTGACNASCPFCVSKMTGLSEIGLQPSPINWRNFDKAIQIAKCYSVGSVVITGKGEPTLFPDQITSYLEKLAPHNFPLIDLQTNGLLFQLQKERYDAYLKKWYRLGLSFVAISVVHYLPENNRQVYTPQSKNYIDLQSLIHRLHSIGYSVRLSVTLYDGCLDSPNKIEKMIEFSKKNSIEQLTLRRIAKPKESEDPRIESWATAHLISDEKIQKIKEFLDNSGHPILLPGHGSIIYDIKGQNVCLTNALTLDQDQSKIRQIIFYPSGRVRFDWSYSGATLL